MDTITDTDAWTVTTHGHREGNDASEPVVLLSRGERGASYTELELFRSAGHLHLRAAQQTTEGRMQRSWERILRLTSVDRSKLIDLDHGLARQVDLGGGAMTLCHVGGRDLVIIGHDVPKVIVDDAGAVEQWITHAAHLARSPRNW